MDKPLVQYHFLSGIAYSEVWDFQKSLQKKLIFSKKNIKVRTNEADNLQESELGHLILTEHNPVYTLGKSGSIDHLRLTKDQLESENIEFFKINRGGDITYHGPGQITGYLILDLDLFYHDLHRYVRDIEEAIIQFLSIYGIKGVRIDDYTGVWIKDERGERKICAIGVHMSRWVSLHGFALNIDTDLNYFDGIIPCGINEEKKSVTSLVQELGRSIDIKSVELNLINCIQQIFGFKIINFKNGKVEKG